MKIASFTQTLYIIVLLHYQTSNKLLDNLFSLITCNSYSCIMYESQNLTVSGVKFWIGLNCYGVIAQEEEVDIFAHQQFALTARCIGAGSCWKTKYCRQQCA